MMHVALLRGINVGGKNKVEMSKLKTTFEDLGMSRVRTYINSGNVIFEPGSEPGPELIAALEDEIEERFGVRPPVLIRHRRAMENLMGSIPTNWVNDSTMKCDVLFLWDHVDDPSLLDQLPVRDEIDRVRYVPGAVVWSVERSNATRSGLPRIVGTDLYRAVTVRNINTTRKLTDLMTEAS